MSISKANAYVTGNGIICPSLEDAQKAEIVEFIKQVAPETSGPDRASLAEQIVAHSDEIVDILTLNPDVPKRGRPRKRKLGKLDPAVVAAAERDNET